MAEIVKCSMTCHLAVRARAMCNCKGWWSSYSPFYGRWQQDMRIHTIDLLPQDKDSWRRVVVAAAEVVAVAVVVVVATQP